MATYVASRISVVKGSIVRASVLEIPNAAGSDEKAASPRKAPYVADVVKLAFISDREVGQCALVTCARKPSSVSRHHS